MIMVNSVCADSVTSVPKGFQSLFDGETLNGWEGSTKYWSVENEAITGVTEGTIKKNRFIIWRGGELKDFELLIDVKISERGNSGIQFRGTERTDLGNFVVTGYQADVVPHIAKYNGMLYEERGRRILGHQQEKVVIDPDGQPWVIAQLGEKKKFPETGWKTYKVIAKGNHYQIFINGVKTSEVIDTDENGRSLSGVLGMQVHVGPAMKVQFKNIFLKPLEAQPLLPFEKLPEGAVKVVPQGG